MTSRGFTLLEVCVALAVLAIGLVSVIDINAGAARLHEQSMHLTVGTLLAKAKMIDLEQKLNEDGFSDFDQQIDGTFDEQGHPEIRWHAEILKPDTAKANDQLTQLITGAMGGGAGGSPNAAGSSSDGTPSAVSGALSSFLSSSSLVPQGSALPSGLSSLVSGITGSSGSDSASGPIASGLGGLMGGAMTTMIQAQVQQLVSLIQTGMREVRLTVTWPDGNKEDSLSVATHFVILQPSGTGVSTGLPPGQGSATSNTPPGGVAGLNLGAGAAGGAAATGTPGLGSGTLGSGITQPPPGTAGATGIPIPTLTGTGAVRKGN